MRSAADPAAELMELRQPESLGVFDDHDRGVWDVDADLDHGRRHEHVRGPGHEALHHSLTNRRRPLTVHQVDGQRREGHVRRRSASASADAADRASLSTTSGATTNVCRPPRASSATNASIFGMADRSRSRSGSGAARVAGGGGC